MNAGLRGANRDLRVQRVRRADDDRFRPRLAEHRAEIGERPNGVLCGERFGTLRAHVARRDELRFRQRRERRRVNGRDLPAPDEGNTY